MENSDVNNNFTAAGNSLGGALFAQGRVTIVGSTVTNNRTLGLASRGGAVASNAEITVQDSTVTGNFTMVGGALGLHQDFRGPMAKPHRMAVLTAACVLGAIEVALAGTGHALTVALAVISAGALITCVTRTLAIAKRLRELHS